MYEERLNASSQRLICVGRVGHLGGAHVRNDGGCTVSALTGRSLISWLVGATLAVPNNWSLPFFFGVSSPHMFRTCCLCCQIPTDGERRHTLFPCSTGPQLFVLEPGLHKKAQQNEVFVYYACAAWFTRRRSFPLHRQSATLTDLTVGYFGRCFLACMRRLNLPYTTREL